ncbi:Milk fat globule-EGF factor8 protein [Porites harrisoni]
MESGHLPDSSLSASTSASSNHIPQFGRLNKIPASGKAGAWCAKSNDGNQWLQLSFGRQTTLTKVATQGRYDGKECVTSYSVSYSVDGAHWIWYRLSDGHIKV